VDASNRKPSDLARRRAGLGALVAAAALAAAGPLRAGPFEDAVLAELNRVRADPQAYARELRREQNAQIRYGEDAGDDGIGLEDPDAVEDAIAYLTHEPPQLPLQRDARLEAAAAGHAARQGPTGEIGHGPPGSLAERLRSQKVAAGIAAESISYGQSTPREVIRQLIVDSGVPNRGHRIDLFKPVFQAVGVGCGPHARWGSMCVLEYAGAFFQP
jgi:uncharacterized protein YkwD